MKLFRRKRARVPTVLQMQAVECGAASLAMVLAYHGRVEPLAELRVRCGVSRDGSKASNILKAARSLGMVAKGFKKSVEDLRDLAMPCILFWNFNHFVVLEGFGRNVAYLNDPALGPRTVSLQELDEAFTGVVLVFEPGEDFEKGGRFPSMLGGLRSRLAGFKKPLLYSALIGLFLVVPGLVAPAFTKVFVDQILVARLDQWILPLLSAMVLVGALRVGLEFLQRSYLRRLKIALSVTLSGQFFWHLLRLPVSFYAQRYPGEVANRIVLNDRVAEVLSGQLTRTGIDLLMVVFYALVMLSFDVGLTLIAVTCSTINILVLQWVGRRRIDAQRRIAQERGKAYGAAISGLQSMETLKASAQETSFFRRWAGYYTKYLVGQQDLATTNESLGVLPGLLSALTLLLILVLGGLRVIEGSMTLGDLAAFQGLALAFQAPVEGVILLASRLQDLKVDMERLDDVLDHHVDPAIALRKETSEDAKLSRLAGKLEVRNLSFGYSRANPALIKKFNLSVQPGHRVALVGGSGSGKSTLAKVLAGLYQPWGGEILCDDVPVSEIPHAQLAGSLSMVEQDIFLFSGTVRENVTLWDDTIPHEDLVRACQDAAIDEVVRALPGGYDSMLDEGGTNLSGGQRQRLEIARALVKNPSILVLDEATSALDTETEKIIDRNLRKRGCTCVIVAHRLSTIRDCDEIILMKKGRIAQRGTHAEMWAKQGSEYAKLIGSEDA